MLFLFLASSAAGALAGGMLGDRIGRNKIIWFSILGALPFTLMLPFADLFWTGVLTVIINLIMSSAFAAILIYAMELLPGRIGLVGGFFYGLSFGLGGIAAAILGEFADRHRHRGVYKICSFLPADRPAGLVPAESQDSAGGLGPSVQGRAAETGSARASAAGASTRPAPNTGSRPWAEIECALHQQLAHAFEIELGPLLQQAAPPAPRHARPRSRCPTRRRSVPAARRRAHRRPAPRLRYSCRDWRPRKACRPHRSR
jgi:hypothetical protein